MKQRRIRRLPLAALPLFLIAGSVFGQIPNLNTSSAGKQPTPTDPRYEPPLMIPPSIKKGLDPGTESLLLSPDGQVDMEALLKRQREKKKEAVRGAEEQITKDEHRYFEYSLGRQFGLDSPIDSPIPIEDEHYVETPMRRFQIIFFTALPITLAFSYGIVRATTHSSVFTGPQTAGFLLAGLTGAAGIALYDRRTQRTLSREIGEVREAEQSQLDELVRSRIAPENPVMKRDAPLFAIGYRISI